MAERSDAQYLLLTLWMGALLAVVLLSLWPEGTRIDTVIDTVWWNWGHIPAYTVLTLLTLLVVGQRLPVTGRRLIGLAVGLALLGLLMEVLQPYFRRTADVMDAFDNFVGILLALGIYAIRSRWRQRTRRRAA